MSLTIDDRTTDLDVTLLSGTIGAEIRGVDGRQPLAPDVLEAVRKVWLDRKVVFFPEQHLDAAQHLAFASQFGEPTPAHPYLPGLEEHPEVFEIDYTAVAQLRAAYGDVAYAERGLAWHTDVTFIPRPPLGSVLNTVVVPRSGGDTLFSDQQAAFEGLSPSLQDYLLTLTAVHDGSDQFGPIVQVLKDAGDFDEAKYPNLDPVEHPVVRTHPETGLRTLFVNPGFTTRITQLAPAESKALLDFLYAHSVRPEYTVRHHWHEGDIGFWDNRATQHSVSGDYGDQHRVIQRVTLRGDAPA